MLASFALVASALSLVSAAGLAGEATFYGGNVAGGHCSFSSYTIPSGLFGTALANWDSSANCGACVAVTGPDGNVIKAMIVDECPNCGTNHLDLFPDAFAKLADPSKGIIDVNWSYVDCGITTPIQVKNKEGVSPFWFSMQVVNANVAVKSLEVSTDGGSSWKPTTRQPYNFFENPSGFGTSTVDVKVTSINGESVIVKNVGISSGASTTGTSNFKSSGAAAPAPAAPVVEKPAAVKPTVAATSTSSPAPVQDPTPVPEIVTLIPDPTPAAPVAPVATTTSIPGANFAETSAEPTAPAAIPTPAPVVVASTSVAAAPAVPTTTPAAVVVPATTSAASSSFSSSSISTLSTKTKTKKPCTKPHTTLAPSAGTSTAWAAPTSAASGQASSSAAVASSTPLPQFPVSSGSRAAISFGGLVAACLASLALL